LSSIELTFVEVWVVFVWQEPAVCFGATACCAYPKPSHLLQLFAEGGGGMAGVGGNGVVRSEENYKPQP
jgi:hypothetical protein